ncbi:MAG: vitamin K epoxide reductase family protein [archaeon]
MKSIKVRTIIIALLILLIAMSGYLSYVHDIGATEGICVIPSNGNHAGCSDVQNSVYGSFLGIKVCHWGLVSFSLLLIIYLIATAKNRYNQSAHKLFVAGAFVGALVAVYFLLVQFFILKTLCSSCIVIDVSTVLVFLLGYAESHKLRRRWSSG